MLANGPLVVSGRVVLGDVVAAVVVAGVFEEVTDSIV